MTAGTFTYSPFPNLNYRSWSGGDGKYEVIDGIKRYKDNPYDATYIIENCVATSRDAGEFLRVSFFSGLGFPDNDRVKLLNKIASSVRRHDFNLGIAVAESKQTLDMTLKNLKGISHALKYTRHGDLSSALRHLRVDSRSKSSWTSKDVSARWLELQFGWLPLLSDVWEGWRAIEAHNTKPLSLSLKASTFSESVYNGSGSPSTYTGMGTKKHFGRIRYDLVETLSAPRSLGLEDPVSIAWELVPFSFVVDWFLPIGPYLSALYYIPQLEGHWVKTEVSIAEVPKVTSPYMEGNGPYSGASSYWKKTVISRTVGSGFRALDIPLPALKPLEKSLSSTHIFDAIALAHQIIGGGKVRQGVVA